MIATQHQKVVEKEAETDRKRAVIGVAYIVNLKHHFIVKSFSSIFVMFYKFFVLKIVEYQPD